MTDALSPGDLAPEIDLPVAGGGRFSLADHRGRAVVVYFYPKADTSGCTAEAEAFESALASPGRSGPVVVGISKDPVRKLEAFAAKRGLTFPLASDEGGGVVEAYGAWVPKSMYGRQYMGIDRSTFLVGPDGRLLAVWRKVKVPGHVDAVFGVAAGAV